MARACILQLYLQSLAQCSSGSIHCFEGDGHIGRIEQAIEG